LLRNSNLELERSGPVESVRGLVGKVFVLLRLIESLKAGTLGDVGKKICRAAKYHEDREGKKQQQKILHPGEVNGPDPKAKQKSPTEWTGGTVILFVISECMWL